MHAVPLTAVCWRCVVCVPPSCNKSACLSPKQPVTNTRTEGALSPDLTKMPEKPVRLDALIPPTRAANPPY